MSTPTTEDPGLATLSPVTQVEMLRVLDMAFSLIDDDGPGPWPDVDTVGRAIRDLAARLRAPVAVTFSPVEREEVLRLFDEVYPFVAAYPSKTAATVVAQVHALAARLRSPVAPAPIEPGVIEALEIIAGKRQCVDNLMSNADVARVALAALPKPAPASSRPPPTLGHPYPGPFDPPAPAGTVPVERAERAIAAMRTPDASLARVPNIVRQSIAEVIEELLRALAHASATPEGK